MTKRTITMGALALATVALGLTAQAQGPGRRGGHGPDGARGFGGRSIDRMAERLGLSDQQKEQLEALREKNHESMRPLFESARRSHEAFETALNAENPDPARVGAAALAMKASRNQLKAAHKEAFEEMKSLLTPEQVEKLEAARERGGRRGGRGPGRRGPQGPDGPDDDDSDR